jgi:hypothetical protein
VNPATARRVVLLSLGTMFAVTTVRHAQGKTSGDTYRRLWATGALALLLSALADFAPDVAGPFALLIGITYVMGAEDTIAQWLHEGIGYTPPASAADAAATGATNPGGKVGPGSLFGAQPPTKTTTKGTP